MNEIKPSEALFVRSLLPHCKRMGAIWLRSTKMMRERYKNHKTKARGNSHIKEPCSNVKDKEEDLVAMVTVLRKIYKEVHSPSVLELIRCWLSFSDDDDVCVFTRGDSRGRMRRIDGGKGPDKVWRLDTLVGMLYHGLPLTSADSSLVYHACKHELCVRPQHLRIKLSSLAVVLVLKALSQAGYSIKKNEPVEERPDEFVDISGPFSIQKLDALRHEFVKLAGIEKYKLASSPNDKYILEQNPSLKQYFMTQTKRVSSPITNENSKPSSAFKPNLLLRLIENTKQEMLNHNSEPNGDKSVRILNIPTTSKTPSSTVVQSTPRIIALSSHMTPRRKLQNVLLDKQKASHTDNITIQPMEGEETELIEIMTAKRAKRRTNWMDSMLSDMPHSPTRSVLDKLVKDITRSRSGSDKESRDSKMVLDRKLWSGSKYEAEDSNYELLDILNNMRSYSRSDISFKMTPNIFSPISDAEELQAAVVVAAE